MKSLSWVMSVTITFGLLPVSSLRLTATFRMYMNLCCYKLNTKNTLGKFKVSQTDTHHSIYEVPESRDPIVC